MTKTNEVTLDKALSIAKEQHQAGNLTLADRTYKDIIKVHPDNFTSLHYLGIIAYQRGEPKEGVKFLSQAININADKPETWNAYAVMLELTGEMDKAIDAWNKALELRPDYPDALSNLGNALYKCQEYKKAQEACEKALKLKPDFHGALINLGNALVSQDKGEEAIAMWEKSLEIKPDNHNALINTGNALRDLGRVQESEEYCRKAVSLYPDNPDALLNLGNTLNDQAQYEEAEQVFKQATNVKPDFAKAHNNLSISLMNQLKLDEALIAARYAIAFDPNYGEAYGNISVVLRELGKLPEAEEAARKALSFDPESVEAKVNLGEILFLIDNYEEAVTLFNDAMELLPESSRIYIKLSTALDRANRTDEALEVLEKTIDLYPEMPEAYHLKAVTLLSSNEVSKALEALDKALEIKPDFPEVLATKSEALQSLGKMEDAAHLIREAINMNADIPSLYLTLSKVKKFTKDDSDLKKMESLTDNINKHGQGQASALYYGLFKAYEDTGEYDKAFEHLKKGADIKRSTVFHKPETQEHSFNTMKGTVNKQYIDAFKGKACESDVPVFIVGMPRSGTTLTEQIISSHPEVYGAGELYALAHTEKEVGILNLESAKEWGEKYIELTRAISEECKTAKRITDKMPGNYVRIGQIASALPNAKIIHCRRNPIDTCLSCYKQLFARGHYWSYDLKEMADHYEQYNDLMNHWRKEIPERFLEINYEDTVNDFENQARKLIDYVGLEWNDACLSPHKSKRSVLTASKGQVIKPIYKTSVHAWKRYEEQLQPLAERLEKYVTN